MHLWPSLRLRDSFGSGYLKKLEWNLHRMNTEKQRQQNQSGTSGDCRNKQKLLNDQNDPESNSKSGGLILLCRETSHDPFLLLLLLLLRSFRARFAPDLPAFMYAESLGGAIALLITLRRDGILPDRKFDGVVLNGAMCGISDKFKPPWPLEHFLSLAAFLVPTWCVVPTRGSIPAVSFKVEWKRKLAFASPRRPLMRPRAATAQELMRVCREVQGKFHEVDVPFLIVHGGEDIVCDPACAEELHSLASSKDKTLKIYPGMWHQLAGEPDENVELVFGEVVDWLVTRAESRG